MKALNGKKLVAVFLLALGVRLVFWTFIINHPERAFDGDSKGYLTLAETLRHSHTFPSILRTPVYPLFIAWIYSIVGRFPQAVLAFQCLLDGATAVLTAQLFFLIVRNARFAFVAGLLYAMNPFAVFYSNMILTETLFTFIFAATIFLFMVFLKGGQKKYLFASSIIMGTSMLCRPIALYVPFLLASCFFFFPGYKLRDKVMCFLIFTMISYAVLVPWYAKNYRDYGKWTLSEIGNLNYVISFAPEVLIIKNNPIDVATRRVNEKIDHFQRILFNDAKAKYGWQEDDLSEIEREPERFALMVTYGKRLLYENLPIFIASHLVNMGRVLFPYYPQFEKITGIRSTAIRIISFATDFSIMAFFVAGGIFFLRGACVHNMEKEAFLVMVVTIFYFSFVPGIVGYARFRVPVLPYISILSASGIRQLADKIRFGK